MIDRDLRTRVFVLSVYRYSKTSARQNFRKAEVPVTSCFYGPPFIRIHALEDLNSWKTYSVVR